MKEPLIPKKMVELRGFLKRREGVEYFTRRRKALDIEEAEREVDDFWGEQEHEVEE